MFNKQFISLWTHFDRFIQNFLILVIDDF